MVIMQCGDIGAVRKRAERLGIRIVWEDANEENRRHSAPPQGTCPGHWWISDGTPATRKPTVPWAPAGPDWQRARRTDVIRSLVAAEIQCDDPDDLAARWGEVTERPVTRDRDDNPEVRLDDGSIRFVTATDGRGTGLGGIDVEVVDRKTAARGS